MNLQHPRIASVAAALCGVALALSMASCSSNNSADNGSGNSSQSGSSGQISTSATSSTAETSSSPTVAGSSQETTGAGSSPTGGSADPSAAALLPDDVRSSGKIIIAMDASQGQPFTYFGSDNKTFQGLTVDMANALAATLGLTPEFVNTSFDALIPGLKAKRYDLTVAPMLMTPTRLKTVDMIGWIHGGSAFVVLKDGGPKDLTLDALCGMTVGAQTGSVEADALDGQNKKCVSAGKAGITIQLFPHATDGVLALTSGRIQAFDTAAAQAGFIAQGSSKLTQSGQPYNSGTSSMALQKDSPIAKAVTAALQHLIDTGAYKTILDKYGVANLAVPSASLNSPV